MHIDREISPPFDASTVRTLRAGDLVALSGVVYTARDAAHKRLCELIERREPPPIDLRGQVIYFTGPSPAKPGRVIGSAGPTTSSRMDAYSPTVIRETGLRGMIGKGNRGKPVIEAMRRYGCVYFAATGGAGALIAKTILKADIMCYEDLGPEAIYRLEVKELPLVVAIDCHGNNVYSPAVLGL
ncbi:MAG: Fe-S-containing hydro-lyase [Chitinivibrionales bacterium]|nr:Fe-S-containing hydro-lyase [Chitinivibrionales bacterium]MBD3394955.1 Fe-S-containing hydro-lyase [Chitinivibrionales bacterium]